MIKIAIPIFAFLLINLGFYKGQMTTIRPVLDTLYHPNFGTSVIGHQCSPFVNGYYVKFGILISNYYTIIDSLAVNLNDDEYIDNLLVLSPKSLDPIDSACEFSFDKNPKRVLVEIINGRGVEARIRGAYYNIVSDIGGVLSHFSGIFPTKSGFRIIHEAGANYSWSYSTEFSVGKKGLGLREISKICSYGDKTDSLTYRYEDIDPDKVNLPDTLSNQCNCDALWSKWSK